MKTRIAFYIESMVVGGAEKVLLDMVNNLDSNKYEITIIALFKKSVYSDYIFEFSEVIKENIKYIYLINNTNNFYFLFFSYLQAKIPMSYIYKWLIKNTYDIEIAFYEGWPTQFVSSSSSKSKKIAWLHTNQHNIYRNLSTAQLSFKKKIYENYDKVIGVSKNVCKTFEELFPGIKAECVYNVINENFILKKSNEKISLNIDSNDTLNLITVGRIIEVKGYIRLILVIHKLVNENYKIKLWMIGDGSDFKKVESLIQELNLKNNVVLLGHQNNPYKVVKKMDLLVCSSYFEGLSTVVIEALILGLPIVTTDCGGMEEIFNNNECGLICNNTEEALYFAIKSILDNKIKLEEFRRNIVEKNNLFSLKNRIDKMEQIFDEIIL